MLTRQPALPARRSAQRRSEGGRLRRSVVPGRVRIPAAVTAALIVGVLSGCGFHLRGSGGGETLSAVLPAVRVVPAGAAANDPFTVAIRNALAAAGTKVVAATNAPALVLLGENIQTRVAAVNTATAKASAYLLLYRTRFRLDGPRRIAAQSISLQRIYSFDPTQVLAREQQEQELMRDMRSDAARQIVRRLARLLAAPANKES